MAGTFKRPVSPLLHLFVLLGNKFSAFVRIGEILTGFYRWLAALALGGFTLMATLIALRFCELAPGQERFMATNAFYEHLGLVGGFLLVAWHDLKRPAASKEASSFAHDRQTHLEQKESA